MRPHPRDPDVQVLLMDTEGLDSPHSIFCDFISFFN